MDINVLGLAIPTFTTTVQGCLQTWVSMRLLKDTGKKIKLMRAHCSYTIRKMKLQGNKVLCFFNDGLQYIWKGIFYNPN